MCKPSHSQDAINPATDSHIFVTLCEAYSDSGEADKCDQLCESIIQDITGIPVSGKRISLLHYTLVIILLPTTVDFN